MRAAAVGVTGGQERAERRRVPSAGSRFFCSWSGGKDAYLALARSVAAGARPTALLTMLHEDGRVSRGHGLPLALLEAQAASLRLPLFTGATTWDGYEAAYVEILHLLREGGVEAGVFGDIDVQAHRDWVEGVCATAGLDCHLPLWQEPRLRLLDEFLGGGARATIVAVDAARLPARYVGRELDHALVAELAAKGVDASGEAGEYHTMVTVAPLFSGPVALAWHGVEDRDGHWVLRFGADALAARATVTTSPRM